MSKIIYMPDLLHLKSDKIQLGINSVQVENNSVKVINEGGKITLDKTGLAIDFKDPYGKETNATISSFDPTITSQINLSAFNDNVLKRSIPSTYGVLELFSKVDMSPFSLEIADGKPARYSIVLNNQNVQNLRYDILFDYDIDNDGNPFGIIKTRMNDSEIELSDIARSIIQKRDQRNVIDFIPYKEDMSDLYIYYTENDIRKTVANKFIATKSGNTYLIGDKTITQWKNGSPYLVVTNENVINHTGIMQYRTDLETPEENEYFVCLLFSYSLSDTPLTINSTQTSITDGDQSILAGMKEWSAPFDLDCINVTFGPNLCCLFKNCIANDIAKTIVIPTYYIHRITNMKFAENLTNLELFMVHMNVEEITFAFDTPFNIISGQPVSMRQAFDYLYDLPLLDLLSLTNITNFTFPSNAASDYRAILAYVGSHTYLKSDQLTKVSDIRPDITKSDTVIDFSNWSANGPIYGSLYQMFRCLMHWGPIRVPRMKVESGFEGQMYALFRYSLVSEIENLQDINVTGDIDLQGMFRRCYFLERIDISTWNMDDCRNFIQFIEDCAMLSEMKINKKYVYGYDDKPATSTPVTPPDTKPAFKIRSVTGDTYAQTTYVITRNTTTGVWTFSNKRQSFKIDEYSIDENDIMTIKFVSNYKETSG